MKKLVVLLVFIAFLQSLLAAFTYSGGSCTSYYPLTQGSEFEISSYSAKDKLQSRAVYQVKDREETPEGIDANVHYIIYDDKDKMVQENDMTMQCKGGNFYMEMKNMMSPDMNKAYKDMEAKATTNYLEYPGNMKVGDQLKDGNIKIDLTSGGSPIGNITMDVKNRKVTGKEDVTTPAGKFSAYKIEYDMHMNTKIGINIPVEMKIKEWIAEDAGVVRSEAYDKKGKLASYSVLSKLKR